ncbi:MAG TPA: putative toxin-antitoxin system toxin component, PIN family [Longimicrobiaceae bacterium]|nr:putative toxin-antitoxin system toxin component, PIN family [Longimicrobiaceae bacterium]
MLDTNVLVSGLLSPFGPPGRILDLVTSLHLTVLHDDRILIEYRDVLSRPKLKIGSGEATAVIDLIERGGGLVVAPPLAIVLPDPDDLSFLEVADAGGADALVTGNERHFAPLHGKHRVPVLAPAAFLSLWKSRHPSPDEE